MMPGTQHPILKVAARQTEAKSNGIPVGKAVKVEDSCLSGFFTWLPNGRICRLSIVRHAET